MPKLICLVALLAFGTPLFASDPLVGTWTLDKDKTKYTVGTPPKNVTLTITEEGKDLLVTAAGVTVEGAPILVRYTIPIGGGNGSVQEANFDGVSSKRVSANVREIAYSSGGKQVTSRRWVVSGDGKELRTEHEGPGPDAKPDAGVDVYNRQ